MPRPAHVLSVLTVTLTAGTSAAQDWFELFPTNSPPGLTGHGMAYDAGNDMTVLFGGAQAGNVRVDDTWLFDGTTWTQAAPAVSPPARAGHPLAYDAARGRVVLFGGIGVGGALSDTWEWDGSTWIAATPATVPPGRLSHPLVWHPLRGTCVMHGGNGLGAGTLTDTWEWNGTDWTQIVTANWPLPLRFAADMAYDPIGGGLVLFSGYPGATSDTWYFDNVDWAQRTTLNSPTGRWDHTMATDAVRSRIVLFGGTLTADTWEFDGTDWTQRSPATLPAARYDDYLVYDTVRGQTMMFGGDYRSDTWAYKTPPEPGFAQSIPFGEGCVDEASASVYENFTPATFDLNNTWVQLVPTGNGYTVLPLPGPTPWFTPTSAALAMTDETVVMRPLGFTLNFPGGSITDIYISSNGFVRSDNDDGSAQWFDGDPARMFSGQAARWCPYWSDLNPALGGSVHFDIDPTSNAAVVTFLNVPEYNAVAATQSFQVVFDPNGTVQYRYQNAASVNQPTLVGWTPGFGSIDPGSIDLSTVGSVTTSPDKVAILQRADRRPVIGGSVDLATFPIPSSAILVATVFGLNELNPPVDLTSFGMPGCFQYTSNDAVQLNVPVGGVAAGSLAVVNNPALAGVEIKSQGAALVPGYNALGAITSNAVRHTVDVN